ncbi:hypothetical protein DU80_20295 [Methanosarcina mazei]|uniref:Uncharacterized protein n=1 Tax=Methanosarcina mazei TaxID=2209 RepID=A0A0F8N378_METMZ|nr:hypothetical protein DU31_09205 [Methanosarcina mazei]KKG02837.1 hypothetical protein DU40_18480 [Methanosarcina mazei]KKG06665.1 hypothetical protein DU47_18950 [Methanosarcina mazei]KKG14074.1 hypothetical protein DU34_10315 [Methanosarcina mazei]KKG32232.1 hypothetical protein DU30_10375 [Methanosarcina mazei]
MTFTDFLSFSFPYFFLFSVLYFFLFFNFFNRTITRSNLFINQILYCQHKLFTGSRLFGKVG